MKKETKLVNCLCRSSMFERSCWIIDYFSLLRPVFFPFSRGCLTDTGPSWIKITAPDLSALTPDGPWAERVGRRDWQEVVDMCVRVFDQRAEHRARAGSGVVVPPVRGNAAADKLPWAVLAGHERWGGRRGRTRCWWRTVRLTNGRINNASFPPVPFVRLVLAAVWMKSCSLVFLLWPLTCFSQFQCSLCIIITSHMWFKLLFFPFISSSNQRGFSLSRRRCRYPLICFDDGGGAFVWHVSNLLSSHHYVWFHVIYSASSFNLAPVCGAVLWGTEEISFWQRAPSSGHVLPVQASGHCGDRRWRKLNISSVHVTACSVTP